MITLDEILKEVQKNNRICLMPMRWNELYQMLPDTHREGHGWEPPLPLILSAWWDTPTLLKQIRFREHLEWAEKHNSLEEVYSFLCGLSEDQWFHFGE